jgi:hypothetical protein
MPKRQQTADVLVNRQWWNDSVALLLSGSRAFGNHQVYRLRGPLVGQDMRGIWLGEAPSNLVHAKNPSKPVLISIFIPWEKVIAFGVIDEPQSVKTGFDAKPVPDTPQESGT